MTSIETGELFSFGGLFVARTLIVQIILLLSFCTTYAEVPTCEVTYKIASSEEIAETWDKTFKERMLVNIRKGPGIRYPIGAQTQNDAPIVLLDKKENWFFIKIDKEHAWIFSDEPLDEGQYYLGWVHQSLVREAQDCSDQEDEFYGS